MSTKWTVAYGVTWHLYTECFDEDHAQLYLDLDMVLQPRSELTDKPKDENEPEVSASSRTTVFLPRALVKEIAEFYQRQVAHEAKLKAEHKDP